MPSSLSLVGPESEDEGLSDAQPPKRRKSGITGRQVRSDDDSSDGKVHSRTVKNKNRKKGTNIKADRSRRKPPRKTSHAGAQSNSNSGSDSSSGSESESAHSEDEDASDGDGDNDNDDDDKLVQMGARELQELMGSEVCR